MKKISVMEFQKLCESFNPDVVFLYDTNNEINGLARMTKIAMRFSEIIIMLAPNRVCLKNDMGTLCFNFVSYVEYETDDKKERRFSIICENPRNTNLREKHPIVIQNYSENK